LIDRLQFLSVKRNMKMYKNVFMQYILYVEIVGFDQVVYIHENGYKPKLISYCTYKFSDLLKLYVYGRKLSFLIS